MLSSIFIPRAPLWRFQSVLLTRMSYLVKYHSNFVGAKDENGIRCITLQNPKQRNILSKEVLESLKYNLTNENADVRCIVIKALGTVFSAGHDLKELTSENKQYHFQLFHLCAEVMLLIHHLPIPVIAQVSGVAAAAGCQLAASCDIVIAGSSAKFSTPGINVGLFCSTPGIALARAVPAKVAAYMLFTGLPISANEAAQYGLVSRVVADEQLEVETMKVAKIISGKSKPVQALGKEFLVRQMVMSTQNAYEIGSEVMSNNLTLKETQNGIKAFAEKKEPKWSHTSEKAH